MNRRRFIKGITATVGGIGFLSIFGTSKKPETKIMYLDIENTGFRHVTYEELTKDLEQHMKNTFTPVSYDYQSMYWHQIKLHPSVCEKITQDSNT